MPHSALRTLLRLRQAALDDARRAVGDTIRAEAAAEAERDLAEQAIVAETRIATQSDDDGDVERFARWLKRGRARLTSAEAAVAEAAACTTQKRAELSLARAAAQAAEEMLERLQAEDLKQRERGRQRELDEAGGKARPGASAVEQSTPPT